MRTRNHPLGDGPRVLVPVHVAHELEQLDARPDAQRANRRGIHQHHGAARCARVHGVRVFVDPLRAQVVLLSRFLVISRHSILLRAIVLNDGICVVADCDEL